MLLPIVAIASLIAIGYVASRPKPLQSPPKTQVSGNAFKRGPYLSQLLGTIRNGEPPSDWLINEATCEAYERGDWEVLRAISKRFGPIDIQKEAPVETQGDDIGKAITSPFDGIPNDAWEAFVNKLVTEKEDFRNDKHVGKFYHSKVRLEQLGIKADDLTDGTKQYGALVEDLKSSKESAKDVIEEFLIQPISVKGANMPVTLSGIMGLLKAAGPQRARSWLTNPEDREKFPRTTQMFLDTNGIF